MLQDFHHIMIQRNHDGHEHTRHTKTHSIFSDFRADQRKRFQGAGFHTSQYKWQPYSILANKFDERADQAPKEKDTSTGPSRSTRWMRDTGTASRNKSFQATFFNQTHTRLVSPAGPTPNSVERIAGMNTWRR